MKIGIIGYGNIGQSLSKLFTDAIIYDEPKQIGKKEDINLCDIAFVCVPTPMAKDGACDTSIVEEVISWLKVKVIVIRSTVKIGFTESMSKKYQKEIVFQPEYFGNTAGHPFFEMSSPKWLVVGGSLYGRTMLIKAYKTVLSSNVRIYQTDAKTAEMAKYMDNAYLALKVIYCNEMYDLAQSLGINYDELREIWLSDPRIGTSHTFVYEDNRGFGGHCYPKDTQALVNQAEELN
ncbi:MAG: hypothetical protein K2O05_01845, partial [Anaeroplasmataceae bacterium]|nr:hypothetical protein [Anaeroplasmataceae bacterium]